MKLRAALAALAALVLAACAAEPWRRDPAWPHAEVLLLGEQHDAAEHQRIERDVVEQLAGRGRLAALALEMAERGHATDGLPRGADEATVQRALAWDERGWPWAAYGPVVMAAVRAGVPVVGANLPRAAMRSAMQDAGLDARVDAATLERLRGDVRDGHCRLLPESQLPGMTRIQLARDMAMAETLAQRARPGQVVVLVSGAAHADATRGVPRHLPAALGRRSVLLAAGAAPGASNAGFDETRPTAALPPVDHCAGLADKLAPKR
ncbi:MAG TPA: ChaN family lipoprotein [Methylibium sp.]|uniref:ChaN family lipoprotein n=1 Tax=Methylibium sp. TaxID=2067992 RepID=UPI002DB97D18|nr:ChaN family lipoprotein [Methylibium sp.]HEU4458515.1 ChaN family lipoprotein [Methylibium sp.]